MALDITHIAAHALDFHGKDIADDIIEHNFLSAMLKAKGRVRVTKGGEQIHEKVMYAEGNASWIPRDQEISLSTHDYLTDAVYDWKVLAMPLKVYHLDKQKAQGEQQVADLVETILDNAKSTMSNALGGAVFNDGSNTNALHGIQKLISTTAGESVGNISPSDMAGWENQRNTTGTAGFNTTQNGISLMGNMMADCAGNDHDMPDIIVGTKAVWNLYHLALTNLARLVDVKTAGKLGFRTLDFQGTPVGWDNNCPAEHLYFINTKYMRLRILEGGEFVTSDWERVQGQLADYCTMHMYGQLTLNSRKKHGVISNISA